MSEISRVIYNIERKEINNMLNNYISAEEFLNQSDKVQKVLLDWWKPSVGDLFTTKRVYDDIDVIIDFVETEIYGMNNTFKGNIYSSVDMALIPFPLLNMSQLINFIEEKVKYKIDFRINSNNNYLFYKVNAEETFYHVWLFDVFAEINAGNILQALWQAVIKLIEEDI
jgi:hypothetical protein